MDARSLQRLSPANGTLSLARDGFDAAFGDFLTLYFGDGPLVIAQASVTASDADSVTVSGVGSFAAVADLPVTARFAVDPAGALRAELRYQLRDASPGPAAWRFSRSFPDLPQVWDEASQTGKAQLDDLDLFDTAFIVCTHAGADAASGVALRAGTNFVSQLRPAGLLGAFESVAASNPVLTLHGVIHPGRPGDLVLELLPGEHAWDRLDRPGTGALAPGVYLEAALDLGFSAGKLALKDTAWRIYSPLSAAWAAGNPSFRAIEGYSGRLSIPSAGIEIEIGADSQRDARHALLYGNCTGVSLGKLAHMLDLAGNDDMQAKIPAALQKPVEALEKLELMRVGLDLVLSGGLPRVRSVSFTVGLPGLNWNVWGDDLVVDSLACRFEIVDPLRLNAAIPADVPPFFKPRVDVTVIGVLRVEGVPLQVIAESSEGFAVRARTLAPAALPLDKLLAKHGAGVSSPTPLTVTALDVYVAPGKRYTMDLALAGAPNPWSIDFGKQKLVVSDVALHLEKPADGAVSGSFAGRVEFEGFMLQVQFAVPGNLVIRSRLPRMQLTRLLGKLCDQDIKLPGGFDLTLQTSSIVIQVVQGKPVLQLMTQVEGLGVLAFEARNVSGASWGFAFGVDLSAGQPSKVPGLAQLAALEQLLHLQRFMLVVSSLDQPGFVLPSAAQFNDPVLATKQVALRGGGGVAAGLNIFADWSLDGNDAKQNLLKQLLGLNGNLEVMIQVPPDPASGTRLFLERSGKIQGQTFVYKLGVLLEKGLPSFFLAGTVTVPIQKSPVTFDVTSLFVPSGAFMAATMKNARPIDLGPFKLSNVALEIGVNWGGVPSLGLTANIDVKDFSSSVAVFFDSTNPANSLVAGSISDVNAKQVLQALIPGVSTPIDGVLEGIAIKGTHEFELPGDLIDELDGLQHDKVSAAFASAAKLSIPAVSQQLAISPKKTGSSWHITDLTKMRHYQLEKQGDKIRGRIAAQFYFAPQATSIGSIAFRQAYYLNAAISFAGFDATATIDIASSKGFSIEAAMDRIVIVDEKLFAIAALKGEGGPQISVSTFKQPDHAIEKFREPHVYINGALALLGLKAGIYADVTTQGVDFELVGDLVPGVHFDVDVRFGKTGFAASGKLKVGVGTIDLGALGKAKINTQLELDLDIDLDDDSKPAARSTVAATLQDASMGTGRGFLKGQTLLDNGLITLVFQDDGNLVLYKKNGAALWASGSNGKGGARVDFQGDGNLVIYNAANKAVWDSGSHNKGVTTLVAQTDGNLVMYDAGRKPKWDTGTNGRVSAGDFDDGDDGSAHFVDASLPLGKSFALGATLLDNGVARLVFQGDGNLCLNSASGGFLWGTNTAGKAARRVDMQADGNLVVYDGANKALWTSGTAGKGAASLVLQTDGNLVIYDGGHNAKWASNTAGKVGPDDAPGITLSADLVFAGQHIDLGKFHIEVTADAFARIPRIVEKKLEKALRGVFKDVNKWADAIGDNVMDGVKDSERVFKDVYGKSEKEAKALASNVGKGIKSAEKAVNSAEKAVEKGAKKAIKKAKFW